MGFYRALLLVSVATLVCRATPAASGSRAKRDLSIAREKWKQIEANVTKLVSACREYGAEHEKVITAVKALKDANSRLLSTVENSSLSIRMLVDDAVFPSLDNDVSPLYQKLLDYTKNDFVSGILKVDSLATAFTSWIDEEHWNKMLGDSIHDIQTALEMVFDSRFDPMQRKQGENMLKITCQQLDPASALGHLWKHLGEGCPRTTGPRLDLNTKVVAPNVKELPCAPEAIMISNNYTTAAALELVQFFGGIVGNLGFVLGACLNVGFEASAKSEAFRFAASVNEVTEYLAKYLFDLENSYFPHFALGLLDTAVSNVTSPSELEGAVTDAVKMLDNSYNDFKHTIIGFTTGSRKPHYGYTRPNNTLPKCASAQYERTTYTDTKSFHNFKETDYAIIRTPSDDDCRNEIFKQYMSWKKELEANAHMPLWDLWPSVVNKTKCAEYCNEDGELIRELLSQLVKEWRISGNGYSNAFVGCYGKSEGGSVLVGPRDDHHYYPADCGIKTLDLYFVM